MVIDPRRTETAAQFEWLGIVPDSDAYLLLSLLQVMFAEGLVDRAAVDRHRPTGWTGWRASARRSRPEVTAAAHRHRAGRGARVWRAIWPRRRGPRSTAGSAPASDGTAR